MNKGHQLLTDVLTGLYCYASAVVVAPDNLTNASSINTQYLPLSSIIN